MIATITKSFPLKVGDATQHGLSKEAFDHIASGDTTIQPVNSPTGRIYKTVLSSGLRTYDSWKKFVALHPKVVHLMLFQHNSHNTWWFAREQQNGVVALKIPRSLFRFPAMRPTSPNSQTTITSLATFGRHFSRLLTQTAPP